VVSELPKYVGACTDQKKRNQPENSRRFIVLGRATMVVARSATPAEKRARLRLILFIILVIARQSNIR
jgi:hypothetical protein